jgi:hypothetical protein
LPIRCRDIREVLTSGKPQISALIKTHGETVVANAVRALIVGVCENISVGKNMTENQIQFAGEMIVEKFWYLKLEDFALCFRRGLVGDYGKIYDRMDVQVLCEWLNEYESKRNEECAKLQRDQGREFSKNIYDTIGTDTMVTLMHKVVDENNKRIADKPQQPMPEKSEFEKMMLDEWDGLDLYRDTTDRLYRGMAFTLASYSHYRAMEISGELND